MRAKEICKIVKDINSLENYYKSFFEQFEYTAKHGKSTLSFYYDEHLAPEPGSIYASCTKKQEKYLNSLGYKVTRESKLQYYMKNDYVMKEVPYLYFFKKMVKEPKEEKVEYTRVTTTYSACCGEEK